MYFPPNATQRNTRLMGLRLVTASLTGTQASLAAAIPEGYTQVSAALTATGVFVINFLKPFARTPVVMPVALEGTTQTHCCVAAVSTTSVTINTWSDAGGAESPTGLHLLVTGYDAADQI